MKKLILVFLIISAFLNSCKDRDDFMALSSKKVVKKYFLRGDGVWNIDEMRVWIYNEQFETIIYDVARENVGEITFKKDNLFDVVFEKDTIDFHYLTFESTKGHSWEYLAGDIEWRNTNDDLVAFGHTITIDKKNMVLMFPSNKNTFITTKVLFWKNVEFQLKLSKK
ncbi:MAG: hypothetical protein IPG89_00840 [Bacteroidetes bacterium]|nr:hypothetical protein [Bacteroidota bacterium]